MTLAESWTQGAAARSNVCQFNCYGDCWSSSRSSFCRNFAAAFRLIVKPWPKTAVSKSSSASLRKLRFAAAMS
jgi:hypothetical protein